MKRFKIIFLLFYLIINTVSAQVGMTGNNPDKSAVLDINEANKGILISSFSLSNTADVNSIAGQNPAQGLLIYNTNAAITGTGAAGAGYYFWEAGQWHKLAVFTDLTQNSWSTQGNTGTNPGVNYVGTSDNNDLVLKANNTESIHVKTDGKVGVGMTNPAYMLDVNGTSKFNGSLFLNSISPAPLDNVSSLVRDISTGQVYAVASSTGNTKPFNYVKYSITPKTDWLVDFNTNIPVNDYTVVVVGSALNLPTNTGMGMTYAGTFSSQQVLAFQNNGTWRLKADYVMGDPWPYGITGTWDIYCLVINNSILSVLTDQSYNLNGNSVGTASTAPTGL